MTDAADWQGRVGVAWAQSWARTDRALAAIGDRLIDAVVASAPRGAHVLDIGCGAGATSLGIAAQRPDLAITGVDLSPDLIAVARSRDTGGRCRFQEGDAARVTSERPFGALVSRHGVMFFATPVRAFAHLRAQASPGARFDFTCFRAAAANDWVQAFAAMLPPSAPTPPLTPGPFGFADEAAVGAMLRQAGWRDVRATAFDADFVTGAGHDPVADALAYHAQIGPTATALAALTGAARDRLRDEIRAVLAKRVANGEVRLRAAAWHWEMVV